MLDLQGCRMFIVRKDSSGGSLGASTGSQKILTGSLCQRDQPKLWECVGLPRGESLLHLGIAPKRPKLAQLKGDAFNVGRHFRRKTD